VWPYRFDPHAPARRYQQPLALAGLFDVIALLGRDPQASDPEIRHDLASRAAAAQWTPADARRAVKQTKWNDSFQHPEAKPRLASRIRALSDEIAALDPS
jgi:hypothetical protein